MKENFKYLALKVVAVTNTYERWSTLNPFLGGGGGGQGVLPCLGYTGTCFLTGYGFWSLCPFQGIQFYLPLSYTESEPVLNRV